MSPKKYSVYWSVFAKEDLLSIIEYIEIDSMANAKKVFEYIRSNSVKLEKHPNIGRVPPELKEINIETYRELIIDHWRLIYRVAEKEIFVHAIIDSRRDIDDALLRRMLNRN